MTVNVYVFVIACCVFVAACLACLALGYHWGRDDGYAAAEDDRKIARAEARRGRHARTQPRQAPVRNPATGTWHLPIPGPPKPQPGRDSEPGTITFGTVGPIGVPPKANPDLSDTGEISLYKTRTDDFIARMALDATELAT